MKPFEPELHCDHIAGKIQYSRTGKTHSMYAQTIEEELQPCGVGISHFPCEKQVTA